VNILVTGGAGFIGSNIVDAYVALGHRVVVVDDLSTGRRRNLNGKTVFLEIDVRSPEMQQLFRKHEIEFVNHQAARGDVRASIDRPEEYADVNVRGGVNLLECCRKTGVRGVVYSSTGGCVYGDPLYVPTDEKHPIRPRDPYGASKASFEIYLEMYRQLYGLPFTIFRYPNVYGPRQNPFGEAGVISIFAKKMLRNEDVVINGTGTQQRDFVFVDDIVRANVLGTEKSYDDTFNVGTGIGVDVNTLFARLQKIMGYDRPPVYGPSKAGEVQRSILVSEKIFKACGWLPETELDDGLVKTVSYIKSYEI
jgi:UDP-glucose 4-epimerase